MALNGSCFMGHLDYFQKLPLGGYPNAKPGDHGTPKSHENCCFLYYFIMCEDPAWMKFIEITFG